MSLTKASYSMISGTVKNVLDLGILADGSDQTSALLSVFTTLTSDAYRGVLYIPHGVVFNPVTVYAAVPVGVLLDDKSANNFYFSGSYNQNMYVKYSSDTADDDTSHIFGSGHHANIFLLNTGDSGSASGTSRYCSIFQSVGINEINKTQLTARQLLFSKAPAKSAMRFSLLKNIPYEALYGIAWESGVAASSGVTYCYTGAYYYVAASTGTTGATMPTHTSGTVSDGGVDWTYVGTLSSSSTEFYVDTDGESGFTSANDLVHKLTSNNRTTSFTVSNSTGTLTIKPYSSTTPILFDSVSAGYSFGIAASGPTSRKYYFGINSSGSLEIYDSAAGVARLSISANGSLKQPVKTVATLPNAATEGVGARSFVSDANATTFASIVAGGGSNNVPVYSDGTNWRIG